MALVTVTVTASVALSVPSLTVKVKAYVPAGRFCRSVWAVPITALAASRQV